jgi:hypothetical protein
MYSVPLRDVSRSNERFAFVVSLSIYHIYVATW